MSDDYVDPHDDDGDYEEGEDIEVSAGQGQDTGKKQRKSVLNRKLMRWNPDVDQLLLLNVDYVCAKAGIPIPWEDVGKLIEPYVTGEAVKQHIAKVRVQREADGRPVPPKLEKSDRRKAAAGVVPITPARSKTAKKDDTREDTPVKGSGLLYVPPTKKAKTTGPVGRGRGKKAKAIEGLSVQDNLTTPADTPVKATGKRSRKVQKPEEKEDDGDGESDYESPRKKRKTPYLRRTTQINYKEQVDSDEDVFDAKPVGDEEKESLEDAPKTPEASDLKQGSVSSQESDSNTTDFMLPPPKFQIPAQTQPQTYGTPYVPKPQVQMSSFSRYPSGGHSNMTGTNGVNTATNIPNHGYGSFDTSRMNLDIFNSQHTPSFLGLGTGMGMTAQGGNTASPIVQSNVANNCTMLPGQISHLRDMSDYATPVQTASGMTTGWMGSQYVTPATPINQVASSPVSNADTKMVDSVPGNGSKGQNVAAVKPKKSKPGKTSRGNAVPKEKKVPETPKTPANQSATDTGSGDYVPVKIDSDGSDSSFHGLAGMNGAMLGDMDNMTYTGLMDQQLASNFQPGSQAFGNHDLGMSMDMGMNMNMNTDFDYPMHMPTTVSPAQLNNVFHTPAAAGGQMHSNITPFVGSLGISNHLDQLSQPVSAHSSFDSSVQGSQSHQSLAWPSIEGTGGDQVDVGGLDFEQNNFGFNNHYLDPESYDAVEYSRQNPDDPVFFGEEFSLDDGVQ